MIRIDKVTTKHGDQGYSRTACGEKLKKDDSHFQLLGSLDELNAVVGLALSHMDDSDELAPSLSLCQNRLFDIGGALSLYQEKHAEKIVSDFNVYCDKIERDIDNWNSQLSPLNSFILPGGSRLLALIHMARAISRRVERHAVALIFEQRLPEGILCYFNRLSDWLFVFSRYYAFKNNQREILWQPNKKD